MKIALPICVACSSKSLDPLVQVPPLFTKGLPRRQVGCASGDFFLGAPIDQDLL